MYKRPSRMDALVFAWQRNCAGQYSGWEAFDALVRLPLARLAGKISTSQRARFLR